MGLVLGFRLIKSFACINPLLEKLPENVIHIHFKFNITFEWWNFMSQNFDVITMILLSIAKYLRVHRSRVSEFRLNRKQNCFVIRWICFTWVPENNLYSIYNQTPQSANWMDLAWLIFHFKLWALRDLIKMYKNKHCRTNVDDESLKACKLELIKWVSTWNVQMCKYWNVGHNVWTVSFLFCVRKLLPVFRFR